MDLAEQPHTFALHATAYFGRNLFVIAPPLIAANGLAGDAALCSATMRQHDEER